MPGQNTCFYMSVMYQEPMDTRSLSRNLQEFSAVCPQWRSIWWILQEIKLGTLLCLFSYRRHHGIILKLLKDHLCQLSPTTSPTANSMLEVTHTYPCFLLQTTKNEYLVEGSIEQALCLPHDCDQASPILWSPSRLALLLSNALWEEPCISMVSSFWKKIYFFFYNISTP